MPYDVCILGGLGHVGLPLGIALAEKGRRVVLCDINPSAKELVANGKMPFKETGAEEKLREVIEKTLFVSLHTNVVPDSHFLIMVLGTPVDEHLNPDYPGLLTFFRSVLPLLTDKHHIILRSTVFPGTTDKMAHILSESGFQTRISFCPERIAEGKALEEFSSLPQIIGAFTDEAAQEASSLFGLLTNDIIVLKPLEAELAKLFTNCFRYIQFAISNQFYQIALENGLDFYRIYDAATHNYPRASAWTPAGFAAGPCLFKDTMQLAAYANNNFFLGHAAMLINEGLPNVIVSRLKKNHKLSEMTVGILGMAFKGDIDDTRESLSYKLKKLLSIEAKSVLCTDPYVKDPALKPLQIVLDEADILIIGSPHSAYKGLDLYCRNKVIVDVIYMRLRC
jgi:UDP-N-acetyl-D-mannosaminuronic acid dehydrogenase